MGQVLHPTAVTLFLLFLDIIEDEEVASGASLDTLDDNEILAPTAVAFCILRLKVGEWVKDLTTVAFFLAVHKQQNMGHVHSVLTPESPSTASIVPLEPSRPPPSPPAPPPATVEDQAKSWLQGLWLCITIGLISYSAAYSHGGSLAACSDMRPKHIRAQPQNTRKTYVTIHTNSSFYLPGDKVPVTVRSTRDFMGFFLQARRVLNDQVAGSFVFIPPGSKLLRCFEDGDTVTHSDKSLKRNLSFVWRSPDQPVGDIKFFVSVIQSYFVYWARIESSVVSGQMQIKNSEKPRLEEFYIGTTSVLDTKPPNTSPQTDAPSLISRARPKPPETLIHVEIGRGNYVSGVPLIITNTPQPVTPSTSKVSTSTTKDSSVPLLVSRATQSLASHNQTLNGSHDPRNQHGLNGALPELCTSCEDESKVIPSEPTLPPPGPTVPPSDLNLPADSMTWFTTPASSTQEILQDPITLHLQSPLWSPSIARESKPTNKIAANFLQQPESADSDANVEVHMESTPPLVTKTVQENGINSKGGEKGRGMPLAMTQMGILLGCSVVLGMALAAGVRCIHAQYCHKRTEVSFSEPDDNVITLRESGEMMHFKKIRENSFVLVQAEYNWITPALCAKTQ
ncbi:reelin domain-containing protein 1 [Gastrophryne carolinensis]